MFIIKFSMVICSSHDFIIIDFGDFVKIMLGS